MVIQRVKVKSYIRNGRRVRAYSREDELRANEKNDRKNNRKTNIKSKLKKVGIAGGSVLGLGAVGVLGYAKYLRTRFRDNLSKMAAMARNRAEQIKTTGAVVTDHNLKYKNIHLAISSALKPDTKYLKSELLSSKLKPVVKGHIEGVDVSGYNLLRNKKEPVNNFKKLTELYGVQVHHLRNGYNPAAIETAAQAMAFLDKYPTKNVILVGHSAGGFIADDAMYIIEKAGYPINRVKYVSLGGSYYGVFKPHRNGLNLVNANDLQAITIRGKTTSKVVNTPKGFNLNKEIYSRIKNKGSIAEGHKISDYTESPEVIKELQSFVNNGDIDIEYALKDKEFLNSLDKNTRLNLTSKSNAKAKTSLSLSDQLQSRIKDAEKEAKQTYQKYKEILANDKIPADKKNIVVRRARRLYREKYIDYLRLNRSRKNQS